jgi:hypothetical protein
MKMIGFLRALESGTLETTVVECVDYAAGIEAIGLLVPEGYLLVGMMVDRSARSTACLEPAVIMSETSVGAGDDKGLETRHRQGLVRRQAAIS